MSDREAMKLALEAFEAVMPFSTTQRELKIRAVEALRTALAAPNQEPSGYAYRYADNVLRFNDGGWLSGWPPVEAVPYWFAPPAAAPAPEPEKRHPGYVIGNHWLETAYERICAGEAEADVLRDCGWERVTDAEALRRDAESWRKSRAKYIAWQKGGKAEAMEDKT